jgi:hypothetical protein
MKKNLVTILFLLMILTSACDHGLAPPEDNTPKKPTGISGTLYFKNWPLPDSLFNIKLVAFRDYPPGDLMNEVISGNARTLPTDLTASLPFNIDSLEYELILQPGVFSYITVAHQWGENIFEDWQAVGQYDLTPQDSLPTAVPIIADSIISGIDIYVDFDNLPYQPFVVSGNIGEKE